ncbi:sn-glycerol-3-phosphate ABC transporter ATP-binding protein UgpC [Rhodobacteraceae bacterium 2CG4]|uniref:sn-glycerol-3-phosphate ABC transporter ATP-binding protein UgpC n=1 Tax=Halovulum marinum TaxID=2662447 RepID=A0A6L5YYH9_9RHOB|nr:ABC transporter ATP-binding protein [Halovulum marinum]MSU89381.1 sn-glycerol-3-phosphate ABC transporter ATP-binding protein UgpC [Halovulum marinum]
MSGLKLSNLSKCFGKAEVIRGVDLEIEDGEFVVFVGPSGCGKSTLLRMISGLEDITGGDLWIGDRRMNEVQAARRGVAMVFQSYALYPHLTVKQNMGFGLKVRKEKPAEIARRVEDAARTLQLGSLLDRYPRELSGGQRQRVAIGRAIVGHPDVFLFDEPLSNLDAELRVHMRAEIAALHKRLRNTMVYVTHDQIEAMTLADRIVVLRDGRIEQVGSPRQLYSRPDNIFVAQFIGSPKMNICAASDLAGPLSRAGVDTSGAVQVGLRPEHLRLVPEQQGLMTGQVVISEYTGSGSLLHVEVAGVGTMLVLSEGQEGPRPDDTVYLAIDPGNVHMFDADGLARRAEDAGVSASGAMVAER